MRIKEYLKKTGQSQKDFVITLIEQALQDAEKENAKIASEKSEEKTE